MSSKNSSKKSNKNSEKTYEIPVYLSNVGGRIVSFRSVKVKNPHNIFEAKQTIWDWWKQFDKEGPRNYSFAFENYNEGTIEFTYPDGFKWELQNTDFPNRNLIPCYDMSRGKPVIHHYEEGADPLSSSSILDKMNSTHITYPCTTEGIKA